MRPENKIAFQTAFTIGYEEVSGKIRKCIGINDLVAGNELANGVCEFRNEDAVGAIEVADAQWPALELLAVRSRTLNNAAVDIGRKIDLVLALNGFEAPIIQRCEGFH